MDTLKKLSGTQKFIIGLIVGLIVGGGATYFAVDQGSWSKSKCAAGESAADCAARLASASSMGTSTADKDTATDVGSMGSSTNTNASSTVSMGVIAPVTVAGTNAVAVEDQPAGNAVEVTMVTLSKTGWVVVQEDANGVPGRVLGAHRYEPGIHLGHIDLLRPTVAGKKYYVVLDLDNGDKTFDLHKDMPILGSDGKVAMASFMAK
jgi:hypothetical protein